MSSLKHSWHSVDARELLESLDPSKQTSASLHFLSWGSLLSESCRRQFSEFLTICEGEWSLKHICLKMLITKGVRNEYIESTVYTLFLKYMYVF